MEHVTLAHVYMAILLAVEAVAACLLVKLKLEENKPDNPLNQLSPEERKARRELIFKMGLGMTPFLEEQEEQETK